MLLYTHRDGCLEERRAQATYSEAHQKRHKDPCEEARSLSYPARTPPMSAHALCHQYTRMRMRIAVPNYPLSTAIVSYCPIFGSDAYRRFECAFDRWIRLIKRAARMEPENYSEPSVLHEIASVLEMPHQRAEQLPLIWEEGP